jgi:site-specific recombinase XerD
VSGLCPMKTPKYRKHSSRDKAFVEWNGARHYFPGKHNSRESTDAYSEFLAKHCGVVIKKPARPEVRGMSLMSLCATFLATLYEQENGNTRGVYQTYKYALRPLAEEHGHILACDFSPLMLKRWQAKLAEKGLARSYISTCISNIRQTFRWAVSEELLPASVWHALQAVQPLKAGKTPARERRKKKPVPWAWVELLLPMLSPNLRTMVLLQWYSGARSQSVCMARPPQFVQQGDILLWSPRHKTESLGFDLVLPLGPRGQALLAPYLQDQTDRWLFSPRQSAGNRRYHERYFSLSYNNCVRSAIQKLNRHLAKENTPPLPLWSVHQLRHAKGHAVRAIYGLEATQAVLGHQQLSTSEVYSAKRLDLAIEVARAMG